MQGLEYFVQKLIQKLERQLAFVQILSRFARGAHNPVEKIRTHVLRLNLFPLPA